MGVIFDGVVWAGLAMIWAWLVGLASVLELVFKKLEPTCSFVAGKVCNVLIKEVSLFQG